MRKIFLIFLVFVNFTLFAQRQEVGRVYFEVRALETPWEGYVPPGFNRNDYRTGEIHFSTNIDDTQLYYDPVSYSDYNGDSAIDLYIKSHTSESRQLSHSIITEVTNTSFVVQLSYPKNKKMSFLNFHIRMDSFDLKEGGEFRDFIRNMCILHNLTYREDFDFNNEEYFWNDTNQFRINGFYRCRIEFILYRR